MAMDGKFWEMWLRAKDKDFDKIRVRDNKGDTMKIYRRGEKLPIHYPIRVVRGK